MPAKTKTSALAQRLANRPKTGKGKTGTAKGGRGSNSGSSTPF